MIEVDLSNVWTCMSLPELLDCEQEVLRAHAFLREERETGNLMDWLHIPEAALRRQLRRVSEVAGLIRDDSDILLVCGCGGAYHGAEAAVQAMGAVPGTEIVFIGQSLDARQWQALNRKLEGKHYSLYILCAEGAVATDLTVRALRWMMERKYGDEAKSRIYVATLVGSYLHNMAQEEGYELFPMPKEPGGRESVLTAAALVPMAVAGMDPVAVMTAAAQSDRDLDLRAFENPAWLYAAACYLMYKKGRATELLCLTDQDLGGLGKWLGHRRGLDAPGLGVQSVLLPGQQELADSLALRSDRIFETFLRFDPPTQKIPVEMDWKDYDGLGFLAGKNISFVQEHMLTAMAETHNDAGVPILTVGAGVRDDESFGAMLHFFEFSSLLTSALLGHDPFTPLDAVTQRQALQDMGAPAADR